MTRSTLILASLAMACLTMSGLTGCSPADASNAAESAAASAAAATEKAVEATADAAEAAKTAVTDAAQDAAEKAGDTAQDLTLTIEEARARAASNDRLA
ncbi:MAG: hypothetical protein AAFR44_02935, partial [Pseudomonadota bacterium]